MMDWTAEWVHQPKLFLSEHLNGHWSWRTERAVGRALTFPRLPRNRQRSQLWGVSVVRDEIDIIDLTIDHLLNQGVDHVLIADHRSVDGTREALLDRSRLDSRVHVVLDEQEGHFQKEKVTRLARAAWQAGAQWIIPFDADELWFARESTLRGFFDDCMGAIVTARSINAVPLGSSRIGCSSEFILADKEAASKVAVRSHPLVMIGPGNHGAARVGPSAQGLFIGHIPYRNAEQVSRKYRNGARALDAAGAPDFEGWHWRAGAEMSTSQVEAVWKRMQAGGAVPELGWGGADPTARARLLAWPTWDPDQILNDH